LSALKRDLYEWLAFIGSYSRKKLISFGERFEVQKGILVNLLMAKRGRYSRPFLNLSVFVLVGAGFIAAPIIKENHPIVGGETIGDFTAPSAVLTSISAEEVSTSTQISDKPRDRVIQYTVKEGDTVSTIAQKFGISSDTIRWANKLKGKNPLLKVGQKIKIPPVTGVVHTVKKGETVYSIAKKYKTEPQGIVDFPFNEFEDLETFALATGQTLIVPGGVVEGAKPTIRRVPGAAEIIAKGGGQFLWPAGGRITQYFVWYHKGLDIANKAAPGIAAANGGVVTYAGCLRWGYGCHVRIDHGNGFATLYAHMSRYYVEKGDKVRRGQAIGQMGCTGRCTGTHVHFEIRKNGVLVNPLGYLE
jgi:murein DD-endopeptidase MepM/ murein hydrolase activator NlpD